MTPEEGRGFINQQDVFYLDTPDLCPDVFCMAADVGIVGPTTVQMHRWLTWDQHVK